MSWSQATIPRLLNLEEPNLEELAQILARNAQKNPRITAKELQKTAAETGLDVHGTSIQHTLANKDIHGRDSRRKPFLRPQHKTKRMKHAIENLGKAWSLLEQCALDGRVLTSTNCPTQNAVHQISRDSRRQCSRGQSSRPRHWSWQEVGYSRDNGMKHTWRSTTKYLQ